MYENPADELYFGEVYRTVLQEAWLPEGAEVWQRTGKSRRGRRPTQQGLYPHSPTEAQAAIRQCFSNCTAAWRALPWTTPNLPGCDDRWGREYWKKEKDDRGVQCSYYDLFMRYCLRHCLDTGCIMPSAYSINGAPDLTNVICNQLYPISFSDPCGSISLVSGPGQLISPDTWKAPQCGDQGVLYFKDNNGATGCLNYAFDPQYECDGLNWPDTNPEEIPLDGSVQIQVDRGTPPFHWIVAGSGFSLDASQTTGNTNTLHSSGESCGTASIRVTDFCDYQIMGYVRSVAGTWLHICSGENLALTCAGRVWVDVFPDRETKLRLGHGCHWHPFNSIFYSCGGYSSYIPPGLGCPRNGWPAECKYNNVHLEVYKWRCE